MSKRENLDKERNLKMKIAGRFLPGIPLLEEISYRGWTIDDMVKKSGIKRPILIKIIIGDIEISEEYAQCISKAFGTSAKFWINLQRAYNQVKNDG